ncbi:putative bifunctional diguanylate cyclase/phosphodiesterase [Actinoplanes subtropicus]|uniref:putative bifunctional diguanylate cyclase/phosphodiesterase n=1 Tax=Actinoplanes subtropicus TaxID=543632 RepID=UPI0004C470CA|nr:EAL domain-containing protein [Actinoplanes subtropicus]
MTTGRLGWLRNAGRLGDDDWARRHRLLTMLLAATVIGPTIFGAFLGGGLAGPWLVTVLLVLPCVLAAARLPGRRPPSVAVALGFTVGCGGLVAMCHGRPEARFAFYIVLAALALYRDWAPFGVFLVATTVVTGRPDPPLTAALHGVALLIAASFQVAGWYLTTAEERRAQENLDDSQAQLTAAFDETPVPMAMFAPDGRLLRTNAAYRRWLGLPEVLPPGFTVRDLPLTAIEGLPPLFDEMVAGRTKTQTRAYRRHDDGSTMWVEVHGTALHDKAGRVRLMVAHNVDVTVTRRQEEELRHQLRHDALTGLLSRQGFEQDLAAMMAATPGPASILYLDVDRFKSVNDGSGHAAGDLVLRSIAARLRGLAPCVALLARFGGDEFVVALPGDLEAGVALGHAIVAELAEPTPVDGHVLALSASVGLAVASDAGRAEDAVLSADTAMYAAKRGGGNRIKVFSDRMRIAVQGRIAAEKLLREALNGDRRETLPVWFQPIVSASTGEIMGAETLVRMRTPDGVRHGPAGFVPAAEETGLVVPLGEHVLTEALRHLVAWRDRLGYVSVNVSPRQLGEPGFVPLLAGLLAANPGIDPHRLVLEITETALLAASVDVHERLAAIKTLGVRLALDDFGTGYSSLTWLQSVPADIVKLDRSFVAGLSADARKASIIQAVLWLAGSLGMSAVAEGVEEEADWHALREAGCPHLQGYLFGKPMPPAEFATVLAQRSRMATTP